MKNICIIAGETSGDMHAAKLVREMKKLDAELSFFGIGGGETAGGGGGIVLPTNEMNFMGLLRLIPHIPPITKPLNTLIEETQKRGS